MAEQSREELATEIAKRLADPGFADALTATTRDGSRPIVAAFPDDLLLEVVREVHLIGGNGNVVVKFLNVLTVVSLKLVPRSQRRTRVCELQEQTTMGLFIARLASDEEQGLTNLVYDIPGGDRSAKAGALVAPGVSA